jgi:hypothetical protein
MAADLLLQSGGFGVVVLDLAGLDPRYTIKIPLTTWFLLRRAVDETRTLLLVLEQEPHAAVVLLWSSISLGPGLNSLRRKLPQARCSMWTGDCLIESIALDAEVIRGQAASL